MKRILAVLPLAALVAVSISCSSGQKLSGELVGNQRTIEIRAKRYFYTPNVITVNKGEIVIIKLISEDVSHGFYLDAYKREFSVAPGETRTMAFKADRGGRFTFRCSKTCGSFHPYMIGYLKVLPNTKFNAGMFVVVLIGLGSLALTRWRKDDPFGRLFGVVPLDWRFELSRFKLVRALFKSRWFPFVFILINMFVFTVIIIAGLVGGYSPGNYNFGVMIVWILWWVLLMTLFVPFIGRFWCMI
ncbi:cupredoxin domain-containing protein [Acidobacteriota bacterium]